MDKSGPRLRVSRKKQQVLLSLLRQVREERGLRQKDVADALKCPQSVISKYESGEQRLGLIELHDVCRVLDISLTEFARRFERAVKGESVSNMIRWCMATKKDIERVARLDLGAAQTLLREAGTILLYAMDAGLSVEDTLKCRNLVDRAEGRILGLAVYIDIGATAPGKKGGQKTAARGPD